MPLLDTSFAHLMPFYQEPASITYWQDITYSMNSNTYIRTTRPIGRRQPPKIDVKPKIAHLIFTVLANLQLKNKQQTFYTLKSRTLKKKTISSLKEIAINKLLSRLESIQRRYMLQSLFSIRNFTPPEVAQITNQINPHHDGNQRELLDPKNPLLAGITFLPFKTNTRRKSVIHFRTKPIMLIQNSCRLLSGVLKKVFSKPESKGFSGIKYRSQLMNTPFLKGIRHIRLAVDSKLAIAFMKIKYYTNRLYLRPRQQDHKFKTLNSLKAEMTIEGQRRNVIKSGIDRERAYRNEIVIPRERALQEQNMELEAVYQEESQQLMVQIYKKEIYIENVLLSPDLEEDQDEAPDYFDKLRTMFLELIETDKTTVQKRNFIKRYQLGEASSHVELILQNINLWQKVKAYEQSMGITSSSDLKFEWEYKTSQEELVEENNKMKKVIAFYVREDYGKNLNKETRFLENLRSELEEMESKLKENRIEEVKMMFT